MLILRCFDTVFSRAKESESIDNALHQKMQQNSWGHGGINGEH